MAFSIVLELEDGGTVTYDNVVHMTLEEAPPDEDLEEGEEERETSDDVDMTSENNPMDEVETA